MQQKRITAIIRTDVLDEIETRLHRLGVRGVTVKRVEGYGEHATLWQPDSISSHMQIDVFIAESQAQAVVETILEVARAEAAGDGIVSVLPVEQFYRVRNR